MNRYFVDTSYWVALASTHDQDHSRAKQFNKEIRGSKLITSEFVILELLNYFSERGTALRTYTTALVDGFEQDPNIRIIPLSSELYHRAREKYIQFNDKGWSLTDCTSFLIMEDLAIEAALTFDHHFRQAGFQTYPD